MKKNIGREEKNDSQGCLHAQNPLTIERNFEKWRKQFLEL
jgi:hypothetical protein